MLSKIRRVTTTSAWFHSIALYAICLSLCLMTTLHYGIGTNDALREMAESAQYQQSVWNPFVSSENLNNTSIVVGWFAPHIANWLLVSQKTVYGIIFPIIFSFTPIALYFVYRKYINRLAAFLSALFFVLIPPLYLEIAGCGKSMIAELSLALALFVIVSGWRNVWQIIISSLLVIFTLLSHYTVGFMLIGYLGVIALAMRLSLYAVVPLVIGVLFAFVYFSQADGGHLLSSIANYKDIQPYLNDIVLKEIIGRDFLQATVLGKVARLGVFVGEGLIALGLVYLFRSWAWVKNHWILTAMMLSSSLVVILAFSVPDMLRMLYFSRWVQYMSIGFAPLVAFGIQHILKLAKSKREFVSSSCEIA